MTGARNADVPATLSVDIDCERRCQVEFDLQDVHVRFTLGQMMNVVQSAHIEAHLAKPVKVFHYRPEVLVRAGTLAGAL